MTSAVCFIVNNDLPMLRTVLPYEKRWADQCVIVDLGSTDGTQEYCNLFLEEQDVYYRRDSNTVPERGFAEARNLCFNLASAEWLFHWDANTMLVSDGPTSNIAAHVHAVLSASRLDVLMIDTHTVDFVGKPAHHVESVIAHNYGGLTQQHRCIVRRSSKARFKGYLHEELYLDGATTFGMHQKVNLPRWHFDGSGNHELRRMRYSYMMSKAIENPYLQEGTNRWWYDTHYPEHRESIEAAAARYKEHVASGGAP